MAGKALPQRPSISRLTSQLDPIPSVARRLRRAKFQPHHGRHHYAPKIGVTDLKIELWLMDEGLEASLPVETTFATRYYAPDRFVMTAGVGMPVDAGLLMSVVESTPQLLRKLHTDAIEDRRFAEAVYRAAIAEGITEGISYEGPAGREGADS